ncbi:hypothetical protein HGQ98_31410, partial [Achromobacter ruhlandii]|nr:hypothetical protein [Achromobacter ruhlandii]
RVCQGAGRAVSVGGRRAGAAWSAGVWVGRSWVGGWVGRWGGGGW